MMISFVNPTGEILGSVRDVCANDSLFGRLGCREGDMVREFVGEDVRHASHKTGRIPGKCKCVASKRLDGRQYRRGSLERWRQKVVEELRDGRLGDCGRERLEEDVGWLHRLRYVDTAGYASLLRRCGMVKSLAGGRLVHAHIISNGYQTNRFLGNLLVQMYGNCGSLEDAEAVFDKIQRPNVFSWNIMIAAYAQNGSPEDARRIFDKIPPGDRDVISWTAVITAHAQNANAYQALGLFRQMQLEGMRPDKITFISILQACSSVAVVGECKYFHASVVASGFETDVVVGTALVNMYSKCGSPHNARSAFDKIRQPNVVSWNAMLAAYVQNGQRREALELFRQMDVRGVKPDKVSFISILDPGANLGTLAECKEIHARVIDSGFELDVVVGTAILNMYGKCGSIVDARDMFDKMHERNVVSWTAMIAAYFQNGHSKDALKLFQQMELEGVKPDKITYVRVIDACTALEALAEGREIHWRIDDSGFQSDAIVGNALINMYGKCGSPDDARSVFDKMPGLTWSSWNAMISAYCQNGLCKEAMDLFRKMNLKGMKPGKFTFVSILEACAGLADLAGGKEVHASILDSEFESHIVVGTALIIMYGKCRSLEDAKSVFDRMLEPDVVAWTAMIVAYAQNGNGQLALQLFNQMQLEGVRPNNFTFTNVLDVCASLSLLSVGKEIHASIIDSRIESDIIVGTALVNMYGKCGSPDDARCVFDKICQFDVVLWTTMIAAYAQNGHGKEALQLFRQMQFEGMEPNIVTFICVLDACSSFAALAEGKEIHASIVDSGFESDVVVGNALINMYGKCGSSDDARSVFGKMHQLDVFSWNSMIGAYAQNGHAEEALHLFQQMHLGGVKPDKITFINILSACNYAGLLEDGLHYFTCMNRDHGIIPVAQHYGCMIDLLGRAGQLDEAEDFIKIMPFEPEVEQWMSLLGACRIHGDVNRAERVAEYVFELDPKNAAPYVLLSNIYAAAGRWSDAVRVRNVMKDRGVKKIPGCSCIEVKERVHEFVVGDASHPQEEEIHAELQRLNRQVEEAGYVPDTKAELHNLEDDEKKHMLCYHSEKLALSFGLISTPPGMPLRIIKNLRVCSDCHSAIKFTSKLVGRKIIVRDAKRFHHFEHGVCSCGDYW